jgi:adenylate cyclase
MSTEVERKFLVVSDAWRRRATDKSHIVQGYFARGRSTTVRVRIKDDRVATITIKSRQRGISRAEFEYRIPIKDARALLEFCGSSRIEKDRYAVPLGKLTWEVDVFVSPIELVMAEVELESPDQEVRLPKWVGREVTDDPGYRNSSLADSG